MAIPFKPLHPQMLNVDDVMLLRLLRTVTRLEQRVMALEGKLVRPEVNPLLSQDLLISLVCSAYGVELSDIFSRDRRAESVWPRQVAMYLVHRRLNPSLSEVGRMFNRDHGTIAWAIKAVTDTMSVDASSKAVVTRIEEMLDQHQAQMLADQQERREGKAGETIKVAQAA